MAKQPEDLIVRILRNIQRTRADHSGKFDAVDRRLGEIEERLDDMNDGVIAALGQAAFSDIHHQAIEKRLKELELPVARLGNKR